MAEPEPEALLKTRQVAQALGVSVSTIKRWVDSGELSASKTVGRHRLIPASSVREYARRSGLTLGELDRARGPKGDRRVVLGDPLRSDLEHALRLGRDDEARGLIQAAHQWGGDAAGLADRLIRPVMERIGHGWQFGSLEIYQEHRASQVVGSALGDLIGQARRDRAEPGPLAMGASPEGDLYTLSGQLCELLLIEQGWEVVNLGPNLPLGSLTKAVRAHAPRLVWLSVHHLADPARFLHEYDDFQQAARTMGTAIILGGGALGPALRAQLVATSIGERLTHLAELARQLRASGPDASAPARTTDRPPPADIETN